MKKSLSFWLVGLICIGAMTLLVYFRFYRDSVPIAQAPSIDDIIVLLKSPDPGNRRSALFQIDNMGPERKAAIPELLVLLKEKDYYPSVPLALAKLGHHDTTVVAA